MKVRWFRRRRNPLPFLLTAAVMLALCLFAAGRLRPVVESVTVNEAKSKAVGIINSVVLEETAGGEMCAGLTLVNRGADGRVLSVSADAAKMNRLKARIIASVQKKLDEETGPVSEIPLGTLLGCELLHGRGPLVPLKLTLAGNVSAEFQSTFESAGINQTRHRITLDVGANVYSFLPGFDAATEVTTSVLMEETIIVGTVPAVVAETK